MKLTNRSSRQRYQQYKSDLKERLSKGEATPADRAAATAAMGTMGLGATPGLGHKRQRSFFTLFREFFRLLRGHRLMIGLMLATASGSTLLGLVPPYATKLVIDNALDGKPLSRRAVALGIPQEPHQMLTFIAIAVTVIAGGSVALSIWGRYHATRITKRLQVSVRRATFDHAVRLPLHRVYELKSGGAASLLREDAGGVGELVFAMLYNPWRAIIQLVGSLVVLAFTDWRWLLGSLVLIPSVYFTHKTWIGRIRPIFRDIRATRQHTDAHATETFGGIRVVRSFSRQRAESGNFLRNNALMARQELLAWWWSRAIDIAWALLIPVASAALLWYGGNRVLDGGLTTGELVMFLFYLGWLLGPLEALASSATQFQNSLAGLDRVLNILAEPVEMPSKPGARRVNRAGPAGRVTLRGVGYTYPKADKPVLVDINLDAAPGEMIAFIGPSGAGKTTLCNLIARFYDPTAGSITFDGTDLRDIEVDSYRTLLGIVEQDTFLFDGTIADNIAYSRRDATAGQIAEAARLANAHEFIEKLPKGYESWVGERGVKLSGGQRQRLTIARAILADPRILILDEATSNLDTESERLIQGSLRNLMAGRTSFVIAHRLSTIAHADRIVVLENGRIVEEGRHSELMERFGRYQQMVTLQTAPPAEPKAHEKRDAVPAGA